MEQERERRIAEADEETLIEITARASHPQLLDQQPLVHLARARLDQLRAKATREGIGALQQTVAGYRDEARRSGNRQHVVNLLAVGIAFLSLLCALAALLLR